MLDLKIDSIRKEISLSVMLLGEKEPIDITVGKYSLSDTSEGISFQANEVKVSREWLAVLASEYLTGQKLSVPSGIAGKLAKILL